jgi:hypothetical protein
MANNIFHIFSSICSAFATKNTHNITITIDRNTEPIILNIIKDILFIEDVPAIKGTKALKRL